VTGTVGVTVGTGIVAVHAVIASSEIVTGISFRRWLTFTLPTGRRKQD